MSFITLLSSKANVTIKNIQTVVENIEGLIEDIQKYTVNVIYKLGADFGADLLNDNVKFTINKIGALSQTLKSVNSSHKQTKWLSDKAHFIMSEEI
jgi:hypothetical protein